MKKQIITKGWALVHKDKILPEINDGASALCIYETKKIAMLYLKDNIEVFDRVSKVEIKILDK